MIAKINTATMSASGAATNVTVECEVSPGIGIHLIGMHDISVKECLLRVVTALQACGYKIPGKKIVVNVKPVGVRPISVDQYDLPIALAILIASEQIKPKDDKILQTTLFSGQLGLDGSINDGYNHIGHAIGFASMRLSNTDNNYSGSTLVASMQTCMQCCMLTGTKILALRNLNDVVEYVEGKFDFEDRILWRTGAFKRMLESARFCVSRACEPYCATVW